MLQSLTKVESIELLAEDADPPMSASSLAGKLEILVPVADLIDKDAEKARLGKELEKLEKEISRIENKLKNANFVDKAPAAVVEKEQLKLNEFISTKQQLLEQIERIDRL